MSQWYEPLFDLLAAQPAETTRVTITFAEVAALAGTPIPDAAYAHEYWLRQERSALRRHLQAAGWQIAGMQEGVDATITFVRLSPDTSE